MNRRLLTACSVVLLHLAALWALQSGMLRRAAEVVVPAQVLSEFLSEPQPQAPPSQPAPALPAQRPARPTQPPAPPTPSHPSPPVMAAPQAPAATSTTPAPAPAAVPSAVAAPPASASATPAATPATAPARLELPSSDAAYLNNPKPAYPVMSKRLGEQGKVVVRVLIGADGIPQRAELRTSSGYDRLDQAALATVLKWRSIPGKRGGVAEAMWFNVPINFVLE